MSLTIQTQTEKLNFSQIFIKSRKKGFACAIYRLPGQQTRHLIADFSGGCELPKVDLEELQQGYVFHPFSSAHHPIWFINRELHLSTQGDKDRVNIHHSVYTEEMLMDLFKEQSDFEKNPGEKLVVNEVWSDEKSEFKNLVSKAIESIRQGSFEKVIVARTKCFDKPDNFDISVFFNALCNAYPNAFVYLTYIPGLGIWSGATPEALIEIDTNNIFRTIALAGTQEQKKCTNPDDIAWTQKEIEEQALVSRYIINCFKKIRVREFEEIGPRTYFSGNLIHLKTEFTVNMDQVKYPHLGTVMLELLHPTSAVCGMPKEASQAFIFNHEGFDREYFSGYLGPVNMLGESRLFVNLRCLKLSESQLHLFAGAGIIINSDPEKEWHETEIKMDTVLDILRYPEGR